MFDLVIQGLDAGIELSHCQTVVVEHRLLGRQVELLLCQPDSMRNRPVLTARGIGLAVA